MDIDKLKAEGSPDKEETQSTVSDSELSEAFQGIADHLDSLENPEFKKSYETLVRVSVVLETLKEGLMRAIVGLNVSLTGADFSLDKENRKFVGAVADSLGLLRRIGKDLDAISESAERVRRGIGAVVGEVLHTATLQRGKSVKVEGQIASLTGRVDFKPHVPSVMYKDPDNPLNNRKISNPEHKTVIEAILNHPEIENPYDFLRVSYKNIKDWMADCEDVGQEHGLPIQDDKVSNVTIRFKKRK